ncbi:MAG: hypothetical protein QF613_05605 [Candidatus Marinimicrobia bacterium]|jgi:hypothetical protein|nr:hypothetical protein [Candidatus Neomarinimicrobiota bacterium]MDP6456392.1 hypothetical protein [Candidatus Neomarinimicrobiota bacterium]MDP6593664.1 hypothetical protein [Candidatus Neomarinimicrobiota bacterium]MDP6836214.1 hypothetical protein [Candidatus Neomarinimicrobiota bacterium]MDP6965955.1 hypothetical protein [Candidatus Neomarinimicrobiota bacterium]|tara:strand:- start:1093 stop:2325 length:1233 start_codon:yes stop_codon:yes gene_type:complete
MNSLERFIYNRVKYHPRLKRVLVDSYQRLFALFPVQSLETDYEIVVREGFYYGFHDKCPWSHDDSALLAHRFEDPLRMPGPDDSVEVGYFSGSDQTDFQKVGRTRTWNWQQGSMLQWFGNSDTILFNNLQDGFHTARIVDMQGAPVRVLSRPVAALTPDGTRALSFSFVRLQQSAPAYCYANGEDLHANHLAPDEDGLFLMDTQTGEAVRLFTLGELAATDPLPSMEGAYHYFSHCLFSPSGKRFAFYHRWLTPLGVTYTRMFTSDCDGHDLFVFPTDGTVTHVAWKDDQKIMAYAFTERDGSHYYLFRDQSDEYTIVGQDQFRSDGHPQFSPDGASFVTDTYPDRTRSQRLILYDITEAKRSDLVRLRSPFAYRHDVRCDLHPRWNREGTAISFDSAHTGVRAMCTLIL